MKFNFKKIIAIVMALLMVVSLMTGCGEKGTPADGKKTSQGSKVDKGSDKGSDKVTSSDLDKDSDKDSNTSSDKDTNKDTNKDTSSKTENETENLDFSKAMLKDFDGICFESKINEFIAVAKQQNVTASYEWNMGWDKDAPTNVTLGAKEKAVTFKFAGEYGEGIKEVYILYLSYDQSKDELTLHGGYCVSSTDEAQNDRPLSKDEVYDMADSIISIVEMANMGLLG